MVTAPQAKPDPLYNSRFLRACRLEPVDATPIWVMRQAGRYMPEYLALREHYNFLEIVKTPEMAAEVTMQPIRAFGLDAAIIFSDILPPLEALGLELEFTPGPIIHNPVRTEADVVALKQHPVEDALSYTLDAIRIVRRMLDQRETPLIGFGGSPFSLAQFAIDGCSSAKAYETKRMMMGDPDVWDALMIKLTDCIGAFLLAQARAGVHALQIFDAWSGWLSPEDYRRFSRPYTQRLVDMLKPTGLPIMHLVGDGSAMLSDIAQIDSDVVGVDWRIDLDAAWSIIGTNRAIQGNLDPAAMLGTWTALRERAQFVLDQAAERPGHIFNLGHGVPRPATTDQMKRLVDYVHEANSRP